MVELHRAATAAPAFDRLRQNGDGETKQQSNNQQTLPKSEVADLQDEVSELKAQIKSLVTQVHLLRKEFGEAFGLVQKQD
jgi:peptidoglycan hydrolase CwlO-like protein